MSDILTESFRQYINGDSKALDSVIDSCRESLIYFVDRNIHDLSAAEDIAMDTFAELLAYPRRFKFKSSLKTYLFTIARNKSVDYIRRSRNSVLVETPETASARTQIEEKIICDDVRKQVREAVSRLIPDYRTVIELVYFCDLSYDEAAAVMCKSKKQVNNLVWRAKAALKSTLEKEGITDA